MATGQTDLWAGRETDTAVPATDGGGGDRPSAPKLRQPATKLTHLR